MNGDTEDGAAKPLQGNHPKFNLDQLIDEIGPFGKFQLKIFILLSISCAFAGAYTLIFVLTAGEVEYRCRISGCDSNNSSLQAPFLNFTTPSDKNGFSKCKNFLRLPKSLEDQCQAQLFDQNHTEECSELIYDQDEITIQNEWNLGCTEEWKLSLVGTVHSIGLLVCLPLVGYVSDHFGRRIALVWSAFFAASIGILRSFSVNYIMFVILEFLGPILSAGLFSTGFILGLELVGSEKRVLGAFLLHISCSVSLTLLGVTAMVTRDWRTILRIFFGPSFLFIAYRWLIPESTRWLVSKNRVKDAALIIDSAAKLNKSKLTEEAQTMLNQVLKEDQLLEMNSNESPKKDVARRYRLMRVLKSRTLIFRIIMCSFCWAAIGFTYYGLSMASVTISGDKYVNFILNSLIEIPGTVLSGVLMSKIGRRRVLSISFIISGVACIVFIVSSQASVVTLVAFLVAKSCATMCYVTIFVYTTELFPTELRHTLLSTCNIFGCLGQIVAPFAVYLGKYMEFLPMILFASVTILAGIFVLFGPETLNQPLPGTIQEAENIGKA